MSKIASAVAVVMVWAWPVAANAGEATGRSVRGEAGPGKTAPVTRPGKIDVSKSAAYQSGKWEYRYSIRAKGTRSEGRFGYLSYAGRRLTALRTNDHYRTPWGFLYWTGWPRMPFGKHGWMPKPHGKTKGKLLPPPHESQLVVLTQAHNGETVTVRGKRPLVVRLKGNPTTGFSWVVAKTEGESLRQTGKIKFLAAPAANDVVGAGGTFEIRFRAVRIGKATLTLHYKRPWEKKEPARTFALTVDVQPRALTEIDNGSTVPIPAGKEVLIRLKGNPTAGFSWIVAKVDGKSLEQVGKIQFVAARESKGMLGADGCFEALFRAVGAGKTTVTLRHKRPWQKVDPARTFVVTVEVRAVPSTRKVEQEDTLTNK